MSERFTVAVGAKIIPASRYRLDDIIAQLSEPGNEADAWTVVSALAPNLAGPWRRIDGKPMMRPCFKQATAIDYAGTKCNSTADEDDQRLAEQGWRVCG